MTVLLKSYARLIASLLLLSALPVAAQSQSPKGALSIQVKDPSGASMQARGSLITLPGGKSRHFMTSSKGECTFSNLPYGAYRLELSEPGFASQSLEIEISSERPVIRTVTMALSPLATQVQVVSATPLPGANISLPDLPRPVQADSHLDIQAAGALDISDFLNKRLTSVYINEVQANPFQPDVSYRGYTASPLLGTPQGLSIYMDGVRMNQPFGDVVSWDLIPRVAISEIALIPGSDPVFGLNTLGGALSARTKDGYTNAGTSLQLSGGSFGRKTGELEHGGFNQSGLSWYGAVNLLIEDGWRAASPSDLRQFFGKVGKQFEKTTLGLSVAYANNALTGNGLQEQRFFGIDYGSYYTKPDITANRSPLVNLSGRHDFTPALNVSGNAYYRYIRTKTFNGDLNEASLDQSLYQLTAADRAALTAAGYSGFPVSGSNYLNTPFPKWRCIAQALERDEPGEKCNAFINTTSSEQHNYGVSGQLSWIASFAGHRNQLFIGAAYDRSNTVFQQLAQLGYLNPDRSITGVDAFADGITGGTIDGVPYDTRVDLHGLVYTAGIYAAETIKLRSDLTLNLSGRYNHTTINNTDRITPGGGPGSLDGRNLFGRFNPSVGVTYTPFHLLGAYISYSQASRAPTSIELGCADPNEPCRLPNALTGDPPLKQVVTKTWEAGLRGGQEGQFSWSAGWFRAENQNDLLFVSSNQTGFGYFKNFGQTKRQGVEVGLNTRLKRLTLGGGYTFLQATYQSPETVDGSSNSANAAALAGQGGVESTIQIQPGDRIPLTPRHMLKAYADLQITPRLSLDLDEIAVSRSYARGNENNQNEAIAPYYLGPGLSPGYALLNAGARFRATKWFELFGQINNVFNRRYYTAAQLGPTGFTDAFTFVARPFPPQSGEYPIQHATFYAPGAPIGVWGGVRFRF